METSRSRELTEPAVFFTDVAKQHNGILGGIFFGVLVSARVRFLLDEIIRELVELFNEDFTKPELVALDCRMLCPTRSKFVFNASYSRTTARH